jgi:hypothetical protein
VRRFGVLFSKTKSSPDVSKSMMGISVLDDCSRFRGLGGRG